MPHHRGSCPRRQTASHQPWRRVHDFSSDWNGLEKSFTLEPVGTRLTCINSGSGGPTAHIRARSARLASEACVQPQPRKECAMTFRKLILTSLFAALALSFVAP